MASQMLIYITIIIILIFLKIKHKMDYWKRKKLPYEKPKLLFGNYKDFFLQKKTIAEIDQNLCKKFQDDKVIGAYFGTELALIVQDPEFIKLVLTKDFYYFNGREISEHAHKEILGRNLFFTSGDRWRVLRQNFNPLFNYAKIKEMFYIIKETADAFDVYLQDEVYFMTDVIEVKKLMSKFTIDCISTCAFGINSNTMGKSDSNNPFTKVGDAIFFTSWFSAFKMAVRAAWPSIFYGLGMKLFQDEIPNFFNQLMFEEFKRRDHKPTSKNDFVDLLLKFKESSYITGDSIENFKTDAKDRVKVNIKIDDDLLAAMCVVIFSAGYETSSSTSSYTLYELAKNMVSQELVVKEVDEYLSSHGGIVGYDCVNELPYLSSCVDEALRLYPVLGIVTRDVYHDYTLPNGVKLEKGLRVHIPVYHVHRNPKYFEDPESFKPERFSPENKDKITPYSFLPFGEGPRICIGARFGKMVVMAGLITVFRRFRVELADGMPTKLTSNPRTQLNNSVEMIRLKFMKRY